MFPSLLEESDGGLEVKTDTRTDKLLLTNWGMVWGASLHPLVASTLDKRPPLEQASTWLTFLETSIKGYTVTRKYIHEIIE